MYIRVVVLCFVLLWLYRQHLAVRVINLSILSKIASLVRWQRLGANGIGFKNRGEIVQDRNTNIAQQIVKHDNRITCWKVIEGRNFIYLFIYKNQMKKKTINEWLLMISLSQHVHRISVLTNVQIQYCPHHCRSLSGSLVLLVTYNKESNMEFRTYCYQTQIHFRMFG